MTALSGTPALPFPPGNNLVPDEMNETGYDAMVQGNHEIDYHGDVTARQLRRAKFPLLGANVVTKTTQFIEPAAYHQFATREDLGIVVLGISVGRAPGVTVGNWQETLRPHLQLRETCDLFVLLTHIGLRADRQLAREFPKIDVIIGGHSHNLLPEAVLVNDVLVAQVGGNAHAVGGPIDAQLPAHLGVIHVVFENRKLEKKHGRVFAIDSKNDAEIRREIDRWLEQH